MNIIKATEPLNEEQLERAARYWCERQGVDPDEKVAHGADPDPRGYVPAVCLHSPRWTRVARKIARYDAIQIAIDYARQTTGETERHDAD